jgi:D-aspartate ligase
MAGRLVILGSTVTALAVVRDAHAHGFEPVVIDSRDGIAFSSRWATVRRLPSTTADDALLACVRELGGTGSWLIATGDPWVRWIMRHRAELDAAYECVLHPANDALDICLDKHRFATWCRANDLSAPPSWLAGMEARPPGLTPPFLIRPGATLHGSNAAGLPKAVEAADEEALAKWLKVFADAGCPALIATSLLQQPLTQYSVPFARRNGTLLSFVARKVRPAPDRCAVGTCVELSPQPEVEALARRAAEKLDYIGVGEAEILHSHADGRNYLIEINARPWLQYALAPASGHDFLGTSIGRPRMDRQPIKDGRCWIDFHSDLFQVFSSSMGAVRRGELGLGAYLRSLMRVNVFARFDVRDPRPAWTGQE